MRVGHPAALNEPVFWRVSALGDTTMARRGRPAAMNRAAVDSSIGVRWTWPAIRSRAAVFRRGRREGHRRSRRGAWQWAASAPRRTCAFGGHVIQVVLDTTTVPARSDDRQRYAAIGRALSDPERLLRLESLADGKLYVGDLSTKVGCRCPT